jgi:DNA modification methylase
METDLAHDSIDLIFTDPDYTGPNLHLYGPLGKMAFRVLKPGGSLIAYAGHYALPEILDHLNDSGLNYWWILAAIHHCVCVRQHGPRVVVTFKPLIWFVKGKNKRITPDYIVDSIKSPDEDHWKRKLREAEHVISRLTVENQVVFDPFCTIGTTGIAALKLGRRFIGLCADKETLEIASNNITNQRIIKDIPAPPEGYFVHDGVVISDVIKSQPPDKALHKWAQSTVEAEFCINMLTNEGDIVVDPLVGSGTSAIAALKLNRRFIGIDIDPEAIAITKGRIARFLRERQTSEKEAHR